MLTPKVMLPQIVSTRARPRSRAKPRVFVSPEGILRSAAGIHTHNNVNIKRRELDDKEDFVSMYGVRE